MLARVLDFIFRSTAQKFHDDSEIYRKRIVW